jgi:hypothetical protein
MKNCIKLASWLFVINSACSVGAQAFDQAVYRQRMSEDMEIISQSVLSAISDSLRCDVFEVVGNGSQMIWTGSDAVRVNHLSVLSNVDALPDVAKLLAASLRPDEMSPVCHTPESILIFSGSGRSIWIGVSQKCKNLRFKFILGGEPQDISMPFDDSGDEFTKLVAILTHADQQKSALEKNGRPKPSGLEN